MGEVMRDGRDAGVTGNQSGVVRWIFIRKEIRNRGSAFDPDVFFRAESDICLGEDATVRSITAWGANWPLPPNMP